MADREHDAETEADGQEPIIAILKEAADNARNERRPGDHFVPVMGVEPGILQRPSGHRRVHRNGGLTSGQPSQPPQKISFAAVEERDVKGVRDRGSQILDTVPVQE